MSQAVIPPYRICRLTGFGHAGYTDGYLFRPKSVEELAKVFELARQSGHKVVLRGAGRSYGDPAHLPEGIVADLEEMDQILSWDAGQGVVEAEPGLTLETLYRHCLPDGWWVPVVSGTAKTTLGGGLAMNIHGKNAFQRGTLGEHVLELDVLTPAGVLHTVRPSAALFEAFIGSAGLLGVIVRVKLQLKRVHSGDLRVYAASCTGWDEQFREFERHEASTEYVVSWIDCFARGAAAGRGIVHAANHVESVAGKSTLTPEHQQLPGRIMGLVPAGQVWRLLKLLNNPWGMRVTNAAKYWAGRLFENGKVRNQCLAAFHFLLDYVPGWERAYLPGGLVQCQFFVPKEHARTVFAKLVEMQQAAGLVSYLGVMKRHRPDRFLISHGVDGFSLALDFKVTAKNRVRFLRLAEEMNAYALRHGSRFYFAKDSTLTAPQAHEFLGMALVALRRLKQEHDPEGLLDSSLARRLQLF